MRTMTILTRVSTALVLALALAACVTTNPPVAEAAPQKAIQIWNHKGGNVLDTVQYRNKLAASGRRVEIRGYCRSACTILITLPNACLARDATVGFHAPRIPNTTIIPPLVDEIMARFYRNGVLARWNSTWKHSLKIQKISAKEYVRLDPQTRFCRK